MSSSPCDVCSCVAAWICLAGCGRINFDVLPSALSADTADVGPEPVTDAATIPAVDLTDSQVVGPTLDASTEQALPAGLCARPGIQGIWAPAEHLRSLSSPFWDGEMAFSPDGLTIYLARSSAQKLDVYSAQRTDLNAAFGALSAVGFNSAASELRFAIAGDGLDAVLNRQDVSADLFAMTRAQVEDMWSEPTAIAELNTDAEEYDPWLSSDGLRLYYMTTQAGIGPGGKDLVVATRASRTAPFGAATELPGVNSAGDEGNPTLTQDELVVIFTVSGAGVPGSGDLYFARRPSRDQAFNPPQPLTEFNTNAFEGEPQLSPDGCELFFASDRAGTVGDLDVFRSQVQ